MWIDKSTFKKFFFSGGCLSKCHCINIPLILQSGSTHSLSVQVHNVTCAPQKRNPCIIGLKLVRNLKTQWVVLTGSSNTGQRFFENGLSCSITLECTRTDFLIFLIQLIMAWFFHSLPQPALGGHKMPLNFQGFSPLLLPVDHTQTPTCSIHRVG